MFDKNARKKGILEILKKEDRPVKGEDLAQIFQVTRQVIVQDIAILRAEDHVIVSTNRGYYLNEARSQRVFKVYHKADDIALELNAIVDSGAWVQDVIVHHEVYGEIKKDLDIRSRRDVKYFLEKMKRDKSQPLGVLTGGIHYHTVVADYEEIIDEVELRLKELGFLLED